MGYILYEGFGVYVGDIGMLTRFRVGKAKTIVTVGAAAPLP
jgi:hypothetical protein